MQEDEPDLSNTSVQPYSAMTLNQALLHLEHRHSADGLRTAAEWAAWHAREHQSGDTGHTHSDAVAEGVNRGLTATDGSFCGPGAELPREAHGYGGKGHPSGTASKPQPSEAQRAAAHAADIRRNGPNLRDTTVVFDEADFL